MNLAIIAITHVPIRTLMDILDTSPEFSLWPVFRNFEHGVSLRIKRNMLSTRFAGVDSRHVSSCFTTHFSSLSISLQFSSLITNDGKLSTEGIPSLKYFPNVALTQSRKASCWDSKHSGPSSAMNTKMK